MLLHQVRGFWIGLMFLTVLIGTTHFCRLDWRKRRTCRGSCILSVLSMIAFVTRRSSWRSVWWILRRRERVFLMFQWKMGGNKVVLDGSVREEDLMPSRMWQNGVGRRKMRG